MHGMGSALVLVVLAGIAVFAVRYGRTYGRSLQSGQRLSLERVFQGAGDAPIELDWLNFTTVPLPEIEQAAARHGYGLSERRRTGRSWLLIFERTPLEE
ncbi:hypothetical protein D5S17_14375 [Pseudonocardiaceae bacterium YIM PH 21723]|nr:hypothetical protein D5S17_14375 [Pseudonocardiaceae bacterium YIM PH 21723]